MQLGWIGVWTSYRPFGAERAGEAGKLVEDLGYGTFWVGGSPHLPELRPVLEATSELVVASGIANVWAYDDGAQIAAEFAEVDAEFPGRVLAGIGIGHPEATSDYSKPLTTMREFLDGIDGAPAPIPPERRCLAALGPKMLDLAAERSIGTHPYFTTVEHTRFAREQVGEDSLVAPEVACVIDPDPESARATARKYAALYLGLRNYTSNLLKFGFTERDLEDGGSDRLIDAVIPHGSAGAVAEQLQAHYEAGADHVAVQPLGERGIPREGWTALAEILA